MDQSFVHVGFGLYLIFDGFKQRRVGEGTMFALIGKGI